MSVSSLSTLSGRIIRPAVLVVAITSTLTGRAGRADLIIVAGPVTASAGSSGSFEVVIRNTNGLGGDSYDVSSDTIVLALSGPAGVTITGATIRTSTPYIYHVSGTTVPGSGPFATLTSSTGLTAGDAEFDSTGYDVIAPGQSFGLAEVTYSVASNARPGSVETITLMGTNLSDIDGNTIPSNLIGGAFTISSAVPEPSSFLLVATGLATWGAIASSRRRRRGASEGHQDPSPRW